MSILNLKLFSEHLQQMNFNRLFIDVLGWSHPPVAERAWKQDEAKGIRYQCRMVAELAGVAVLEVVAEGDWPDEAQRMAVWRQVSQSHYENLLIFLDRADKPAQSLWYWVKRTKDAETGKPKSRQLVNLGKVDEKRMKSFRLMGQKLPRLCGESLEPGSRCQRTWPLQLWVCKSG